MKSLIRIGTRGSKLALWQANWVKNALEKRFGEIVVEIVKIKTRGDKILDVPLARVGGKGLFVKEIEQALLEKSIDLAVHSMKDMPAVTPAGLEIRAVPERENPRDVLISLTGKTIDQLPPGAVIGTSSLRRRAQLLHLRPDLKIKSLRGNLDTRLKKLESGEFDGIILAAAGIHRLGAADKVTQYMEFETILPAVGQGALCLETRNGDPLIGPFIDALDHGPTRTAVEAERAFLARLEGGCQVPIAAHARIENEALEIVGLVADLNGRHLIKAGKKGKTGESLELGLAVAEVLLAKGAQKILEQLKKDET